MMNTALTNCFGSKCIKCPPIKPPIIAVGMTIAAIFNGSIIAIPCRGSVMVL